ncbi:MAG TPA: hypothetical protein VF488_13280, partial [Gemmatimonadaceae bacterium]
QSAAGDLAGGRPVSAVGLEVRPGASCVRQLHSVAAGAAGGVVDHQWASEELSPADACRVQMAIVPPPERARSAV